LTELQAGDPRRIGPYALLGRLGSGGMGQVFLGRSPGGRLVAVKVIHAPLARDPGFRARFAREVAAARKVSGLFTAPVVDAELDGPDPWLVTAYVPGLSLADAVARHGPLPEASTAALAAGLAEGLSAIHAAGVVHRDLKPSNVLLARDGPRIIDFGIAWAAEATALTGTGFLIGSPGYMSPEQAQGHAVGPASDIFSLGAVLGFAVTGQGPFGTGDTAALLYRVVHGKPELGEVPGPLRPLLRRNLAKEPARRPTAEVFLANLTAAYPSAPDLTGDWLPAPVLAASTAPALDPDAGRRERAARGAAGPPTPPTQTPAAHQARPAGPAPPAAEPARTGARAPSPPQVRPAGLTARRRWRWSWVAAGGTVGAAVIAVVIVVLLPRSPAAPTVPSTRASGTSAAGHHVRSGATPTPGSTPSPSITPSPVTTPAHEELLLTQLRTGDCLTGSNLGLGTNNPWPKLSLAVPCGQPHLAEVFFADDAYWTAAVYPGDASITAEADAKCSDAYTAYVGIPDDRSIFDWDNIFPYAADWSHGNRELVCVAYYPTPSAPGGTPLSGSIKGTQR
jgi:hypothetical protein